MAQHKWHKEIVAWASGAEIEYKKCGQSEWDLDTDPYWNAEHGDFRIKPQPKEPQYLYIWKPYDEEDEVVVDIREPEGILDDGVYKYIGKVKLEVDY